MSGAVPSGFLALPRVDPTLAREVQDDLEKVEELLRESVRSSDPMLNTPSRQLALRIGRTRRMRLGVRPSPALKMGRRRWSQRSMTPQHGSVRSYGWKRSLTPTATAHSTAYT